MQCSLPLHFCEKCFPRRCFLNYFEAISYIKNIERAGSDYGVERMRLLLDLLGSPDRDMKIIHVAGTNGKGSVCAYLTSVLCEAGYRVGTYNSPSVFCYNERWCIDKAPLADGLVAKYLTEVKDCIDGENERRKKLDALSDEPLYQGALNPTAFEIETAVAMLAFKDCDVAVLETGLGGRWDATNAVLNKELAIITPIGLDHCALLGDTIGQIAEEKAAIIRDDCVTCMQPYEAMSSILNPYRIEDGKRINIKANVTVCAQAEPVLHSLNGQSFLYDGEKYEIPLLGEHQLQNASIAICAVKRLREKGFEISENALKNGLKKTVWHARLEVVKNAEKDFNIVVPQGKILVFDGAHNPHGALALANALKDYFANKKIHIVLGMLADKDVDGVVDILAPLAKEVTAVTPHSPRALDKSELKQKVQRHTCCGVAENTRFAVQAALDGDCDVAVLCGSLTHFADLKA